MGDTLLGVGECRNPSLASSLWAVESGTAFGAEFRPYWARGKGQRERVPKRLRIGTVALNVVFGPPATGRPSSASRARAFRQPRRRPPGPRLGGAPPAATRARSGPRRTAGVARCDINRCRNAGRATV